MRKFHLPFFAGLWLTLATLFWGGNVALAEAAEVVLGDQQTDEYLPRLTGKRVALFCNHSALVGDKHLLEVLLEEGVQVTGLLAPEHGIRGKAAAGASIADQVDEATGIPIMSLYDGTTTTVRPSAETMGTFDVLLIDIQDVGLRYYTYYITICDLLEACSDYGKEVILLDRPNPNGHYVDGPVLDMSLKSHIGRLPIPVVHGMTLGELMRMAIGENWLSIPKGLNFDVIPCLNYTHQTPYAPPVPPSPNLPNLKSIYLYPSLCPFEGTAVSIGRGTSHPFQCFGHPALKGEYSYSFTPQSVPAAPNPPLQGEVCYGLDFRQVSDADLRHKEIDLSYVIDAYRIFVQKGLGDKFFHKVTLADLGEVEHFDLSMGQAYVREAIIAGKDNAEIRAMWQQDVENFRQQRKPYLLYEE
ncbi:MAG: DUF1343 domain-containing protein [Selenomonadaceae bacterium]|nr:DUF1343 domain-containing protein [Selenomonadaceae bacterium]